MNRNDIRATAFGAVTAVSQRDFLRNVLSLIYLEIDGAGEAPQYWKQGRSACQALSCPTTPAIWRTA
jgi:hypothetical protein